MNPDSRRLNILLLTPQLPYPPHQGTSLRNLYILRGLAARHNVDLLSFREEDPGDINEPLVRLQAECDFIRTVAVPRRTMALRLYRLFTDSRPDMAHRLQSAMFDRSLEQMLRQRKYDLVQVEGIEMARLIPLVRTIQPDSRIVFDDHNAEAELQWRAFLTDVRQPRRWPLAFYSLLQSKRLRRYEAWACKAADAVSVVSNADCQHLQQLVANLDPMVIPNCIDVETYSNFEAGPLPQFDLVFSGKMDYRPNVDAVLWFAQEIWPLIHAARPETSWAIVGQKPHERLSLVQELPNVTLTGFVPHIQPYLLGASVYVMPFRMGSGTRLKLVEAMASGKAIVSTAIGAEGYPVKHGEQLLLADKAQSFADAVLNLLVDGDERKRLGSRAQAFAVEYDWRRVIPRFEDLYRSLGL